MIWILFVNCFLRAAMLWIPKSLWGDEFYSLAYASQGGLKEILAFVLETNHPPLYYLLLKALISVFGESEIVLRFLSWFPGVLIVLVVYALGKKLVDKSTAVLSSLLVAVSPYFLQSSNEIRPYSLISFLSALSLLFFLKAFHKPRYAPLYAISLIVLTYVGHTGIFIVVATTFVMLMRRREKLWGVQISVFLALIPWAVMVLYQSVVHEKVLQVSRVQEYWKFSWLIKKSVGIFWHVVCGYQYSMLTVNGIIEKLKSDPVFWMQGVMTGAAVALAGWAVWRLRTEHRDFFYIVLGALLLPWIALFMFYPIRLDARYLSFSVPLLFLLLGYGFSRLRRKALSVVGLGALIGVSLLVDVYQVFLPTDAIHKQDFRRMAVFVTKFLDPSSAVVGCQRNYQYYVHRLELKPQGRAYERVAVLNEANTQGVKQIWVLKETNMHVEVTESIASRVSTNLEKLGFVQIRRVNFGGPEAPAAAWLYVKTQENS